MNIVAVAGDVKGAPGAVVSKFRVGPLSAKSRHKESGSKPAFRRETRRYDSTPNYNQIYANLEGINRNVPRKRMIPFASVLPEKRTTSLACGLLFFALQVSGVTMAPVALAQEKTADTAQSSLREVIAAVPRSWPPQYGVDDNGKPIGFAIDIMEEIATRANLRVSYRIVNSFSDVEETMRAGHADLVPNSGITPEREKVFSFTAPIETFAVSLFVRSNANDINGLNDLVGKRVGVVEWNVGEKILKRRKDIKAVVYRTAEETLFGLISGQDDALIYPQPVMTNLAQKANIENQIKVAGEPLKEIKRGIRVQKHETELFAALDTAVRDLVQSPTYQKIYAKWYGKPKPYWTVTRVVWTMGGVIAVLFISMVWWRYRVGVQMIQTSQKSEQRLRESEDLLNSVFENVPVGLLIKDPGHIVERANSTYLRWYGLGADTMTGRRSDEIEDFQPAEEAEFMNAQEREVLATGLTNERQVDRPFDDGQIHTINITKFPVYDQQGNITKVGSVSIDLTDLKKGEQELKSAQEKVENIVSNLPGGIFRRVRRTDGTEYVEYYMGQLSQALGVETKFGKSSPKVISEFTLPEYRNIRDKAVQKSADTMERCVFEYPVRMPDESVIWVQSVSVPHRRETGEIVWDGINLDITDRVQADEERRLALAQAEKANQAKSEFLALMSHDLRTPLNAILGFADIMSHQYWGTLDVKKYQEYAEDIHSSGEHLLSLVNDILDLSTIEAGRSSLDKENISAADVVTECKKTIEDKARSLGIDLVTKVPKDLPSLYADRRAIKQILLNLLSNSIKFTPEGGKLTLRVTATNEYHTIEVSDTGTGIPAEKIATLTDPFVRGETDPHKTEEGSGLGLAIVKSLVDLHDGNLDIKSKVGEGTTVTVTLPNGAPYNLNLFS